MSQENTTNPTETPAIKKTMVSALAFVTEHGRMSADNLAKFTADYCIAKGRGESNGPREVTILKTIEGIQLGRKCTATGLWFDNSHFSKNTTINKPAEKVKVALYHEGKKLEKDAQSILLEAKDIVDVNEKVAKYEEYDAALASAKDIKATFVVTDEMNEGGVATIEELAQALGVEVNPVKPTEPDAETTEEA